MSVVSAVRRAGVHAAAMFPALVAIYVLVAWLLPDERSHVATVAALGVLLVTSLLVALLPQPERLVRHLARRCRQTVAGFFAAMYIVSIGLGYLVGGVVHGDGGGGAIVGGVIVVFVGALPLYLGLAAPVGGTAIWLPYAIVSTVATIVLLPAFGIGVALLPIAVASWLAHRAHRRRPQATVA